VGSDLAAEGNAAGLRQSPVIVGGAEPAVGDHHRVRQHAPFLGERLGAMQSRAVHETFKQKGVVGWGDRGRVCALRPNAFSMTRKIALPHATAPHNFSTSIWKLWNRRNINQNNQHLRKNYLK
jgi:hypothetical protein